jgi:Putative peptidoglycan binding domain/HlyD family secretion protein
VVLIAVVAVIAAGRLLDSNAGASGGTGNGTSTALAPVTRGPLTSQTTVSATIAYTGTYSVINQAGGTITALPAVGQVVQQGQALYGIDGSPVVLLLGSTPVHRALQEGMSGADVLELNADLVALGLASRAQLDPSSDYFGAATAAALMRLQANLGLVQSGTLALGQAIVLPTAARITTVSAVLGAKAQAGQTVLQATSTTKLVIVELDAALQASVRVGDKAIITLPDNSTTPGTVTTVGTVATSSSSDSGGSGSSGGTSTVEVDITLDDSAAVGSLDQAPVQVAITTARVADALIVPVNALLALAGGGYAVETVDARGIHHLVPVTLGLFDDADGLVQVRGAGLRAGQQVVVPSP